MSWRDRLAHIGWVAAWCGLAAIASAEESPAKGLTPIAQPQRLSTWLRAQPLPEDGYALGLMWRTPQELARQAQQYDALLAEAPLSAGLRALLMRLPPTGRMPQPVADADWLEAYARKDPMLQAGDSVQWLPRPNNLRVVLDDGSVCEIPHRPGAQARDYVEACRPGAPIAWAWVAQPDGRVQRVGLRPWNPSLQSEPAPGAWIWAPENTDAQPAAWHPRVAQWLANQGPSNRLPLTTFDRFERQVAPEVPATTWLDAQARHHEPRASYNDWGIVGLLQTPTARMQPGGFFGLTQHHASPYRKLTFMFQPLDWLEAGFRYTSITNRRYGPQAYSGDQSYLDKSIDVKARLWRESEWAPDIAAGIRDVGGTGLFSSEYLVASKRTGRADWSVGLAWGNMGARGTWRNPLSRVLGSRFDARTNTVDQGGQFATSAWFRGNAAWFGGVEYQTPWNLALKLEYDANHYQREPLGNVFDVRSPINWGLVYRPTRWADFTLGVERGHVLSAGVTFYTDLASLHMPKVAAPRTPAVVPQRPTAPPDWQRTATDIEQLTLWEVTQIRLAPHTVVVEASETLNPYPEDRLDKAMAVLHRDAPPEVDQVEIHHRAAGSVIATEVVNRSAWVQRQTEPPRTQAPVVPTPVHYSPVEDAEARPQWPAKATRWTADYGLDLVQTAGGPDGYLYQFQGYARMGLHLPWNLKLSGTLAARLYDNYDKYVDGGSSKAPRVRTLQKDFLKASRYTLPDLTLSKTERLASNWYGAAYVGYMEWMYGGWGTEVLYRQPRSPWAIGMDYNRVRMRDFRQNFAFQELRATTGHVTGYWETPWEGIVTSLAVGQYLAGDRGATWSVSKVFDNGTTLTGYVTRTNMPPEIFGEGSFDKGILLKVPFDAFLTRYSRDHAHWSWKPLVRDGGAILGRPVNLFNDTGWLSPSVKARRMAPDSNDRLAPDDQVEPYERKR